MYWFSGFECIPILSSNPLQTISPSPTNYMDHTLKAPKLLIVTEGSTKVNDGSLPADESSSDAVVLDLSSHRGSVKQEPIVCTTHSKTSNIIVQNVNFSIAGQDRNPRIQFTNVKTAASKVTAQVKDNSAKSNLLNPATASIPRYQPILPAKVPKSPVSNLIKLSAIDNNSQINRTYLPIAPKRKSPVQKISPAAKTQTVVFCPVTPQSQSTYNHCKITPVKPILPAPPKPLVSPVIKPTPCSIAQKFRVMEKQKNLSADPPKTSQASRPTSIVHPFNTSKMSHIRVQTVSSLHSDNQNDQATVASSVNIPPTTPIAPIEPNSAVTSTVETLVPEKESRATTLMTAGDNMKEVSANPPPEPVASLLKVSTILSGVVPDKSQTNVFPIKTEFDETKIEESIKDPPLEMEDAPPLKKPKSSEVQIAPPKKCKNIVSSTSKTAVIKPSVLRHYVNNVWIDEVFPVDNAPLKSTKKSITQNDSKAFTKHVNYGSNSKDKRQSVLTPSKKKSEEFFFGGSVEVFEEDEVDSVADSKPSIQSMALSNPIDQRLSLQIPTSPNPGSTFALSSTGTESSVVLSSGGTHNTTASSSSGIFSILEESSVLDRDQLDAPDNNNSSTPGSVGLTCVSGRVSPPNRSPIICPTDRISSHPIMSPRAPCEKPILQWTTNDVYNFIMSIPAGCEYAEQFKAQDIDGQALSMLKEIHLMNAMKMKLGPALKICSLIKKFKDQCL